MAADIEEPASSERRRKRKRSKYDAKLVVEDKVEVRSVEEGFLGSWHSGTVIFCECQVRWVKYDYLLRDDGSENLIDCVGVPLVLDGIASVDRSPSNYRGIIRPLPPPIDFGKWCLHYGQCVDVYFLDAWWEGVIFDHEDGSEVRKVFFPDMGDVMDCGIEMIRITQDWDELSEDWKPRGNWLFLELIEEFELEWPLQVSVRQIWYDMRGKKGFEKLKEWTSSLKDIWKILVSQVIYDNFKITLKEFFHKLDSSGELAQEAEKVLRLFEPALDLVSKPGADLGKSIAVVPFENDGPATGLLPTKSLNASVPPAEEEIYQDNLGSAMRNDGLDTNVLTGSGSPCHEGTVSMNTALSILPFYQDEFSTIKSNTKNEEYFSTRSKKPNRKLMSLKHKESHKWLPAGHDLVPEAEFCPDAVIEYNRCSISRKKPPTTLKLNVRKHLAYLGWTVEWVRDKGNQRLRYTSPEGKCYFSLCKLCQDLCVTGLEILPLFSQDDKRSCSATPDGPSSSLHIIQPQAIKRAPVEPSPDDYVFIESEYCPQAVVDYYSFSLEDKNDQVRWWKDAKVKDIQSKAKQHLSAVGWLFSFMIRNNGKRELRYTSPRGKVYSSLLTACKHCMDDGLFGSNASTRRPNYNKNVSKQAESQIPSERSSSALMSMEFQGNLVPQNELSEKWPMESSGISPSKELVELRKAEVQGIRELQKKRKNGPHLTSHVLQMKGQNAGFPTLKKGKESRSLMKKGNDWKDNFPTRVLRSSKRARQVVVPSSTHHNPRTVLSWLIDNNVVLPRAKVHYCCRKDHHPMAEGRITRDGIKCSCCQKIFALSKFEAHAGSTYHQPSANIFLEDGRSLLDCQLQLKHDNNMRSFMTEPHEMKGKRHHRTNDYICSVCHFGGELVLCDQCPSSFHTTCLGLKGVPDGDWFCPSCCCGICGQSRFIKDTEQFLYNSVINCEQCEHQYHIGCLKKRGLVTTGSHPEGNWFCNKRCKRIFLGLRKLLGKPFPVGKDNLTWTLFKYIHDVSDNEASAENYSKLNVALGVMHECFEPVKESRTRRDLVEDIIFSRWSELNRLNFRGFYTVLLERNDELITVATVRVYGEKVAEVPLVGTRFQYRRLGMCRILMNVLEKKLMELGVERLVLPAVPSVLNTWTTSFGFSKMTESERLNFLDYTFLDFQGTIMCQKLLAKIPSTESNILRGSEQNLNDDINGRDIIDLDGNSAVSEVFQAEQIEDIVDQGPVYIAGGDRSNGWDSTAPPVVVVNQQTGVECIPFQSEISLAYSVEDADHEEGENTGNGLFKCYKRRKISA